MLALMPQPSPLNGEGADVPSPLFSGALAEGLTGGGDATIAPSPLVGEGWGEGVTFKYGNACFNRFSMSDTARWVMSMPIQRRFSFCAACTAVPQPQKGSSTTSPSLLDALMMRSRRARGFWVG